MSHSKADGRAVLANRMRNLAVMKPEHAVELREKADAMESAASEFYSQTADDGDPEKLRRFIGTWARARKLFCEITGEPLV